MAVSIENTGIVRKAVISCPSFFKINKGRVQIFNNPVDFSNIDIAKDRGVFLQTDFQGLSIRK